jgi:hypothetical protein
MRIWIYLARIMTIVLFADCAMFAQARKQVSYDWAADQLTPTLFYTVDDYSLQVREPLIKSSICTVLTSNGM